MNSPMDFMQRALALGRSALVRARPNPAVGCVIVRDGRVIGEGATGAPGEPHAEQGALANCLARSESPKGATVYVTLEPCNHINTPGPGRRMSCVQALIEAEVARVVVAIKDDNPRINGAGLDELQAAGIAVELGLCADEATEHHIGFLTRKRLGRPFVRLKIAASLDGRTALADGRSQWITGEAARLDGHRFRARACAILTGSGTLRQDDPQLTVRGVPIARQPMRIIVDHLGAVWPEARALSSDAPVLVAHAGAAPTGLPSHVESKSFATTGSKVHLAALLAHLGERGLNELHVEAGSRLSGALIVDHLVDELLVYLAPKLLGHTGREMFHLPQLSTLPTQAEWTTHDCVSVGEDIRLRLRRRAPTV